MRGGDVAHVHHGPADVGAPRQLALEQLAHQLRGGVDVCAEDGAKDQPRVDGAELEALVRGQLAHQLPGGALGDGLALLVRPDERRQLAPVSLVVHLAAVARVAVQHGGDRRGHHHAGRAVAGGARRGGGGQHAHRAVARRLYQVVLVRWRRAGQGRGHVDDEAAAAHGRCPPLVASQLGGHQLQSVKRGASGQVVAEDLAHLWLLGQRAQRAAHAKACLQELQDRVLGDEARGSGDEDGLGSCRGGHGRPS